MDDLSKPQIGQGHPMPEYAIAEMEVDGKAVRHKKDDGSFFRKLIS